MRYTTFIVFASLSVVAGTAQSGWQDLLDSTGGLLQKHSGQTPSSVSALTQQQVIDGLKQALDVGVERAIALLGRQGGYRDDAAVRIPMPGALKQVEQGLRAVGQGEIADRFIDTMNRAAERAVPETTRIFTDAIREMSLDDARRILEGPDDAATEYFKAHSYDALAKTILPIVKQATAETGVTAAYKKLVQPAGSGLLGSLVDTKSMDLDRYVTDRALDGLFLKLAQEEAAIRRDPVQRSTELLQQVFGAVSR